MKSITKRIISTLAICGALVLEAGATAIGSLGKALNNIAKVDAADTTASWTATSGAFGSSGSPVSSITDDKNNVWSLTISDSKYLGWSSDHIQVGSKNNPTSFSLTCSSITQTISSISFVGWSYNGLHTYSISVGGTTVKSGNTSSASGTVTADSLNATGTVVISFNHTSGRAAYLKSFSITYGSGSSPSTTYSINYLKNTTDEVTGMPSAETGLSAGSHTLSTAKPTRSGYDFVGWNTNSSATTGITSVTIGSSDVDVYAIWKKQGSPAESLWSKVSSTSDVKNGDKILLVTTDNSGYFNTTISSGHGQKTAFASGEFDTNLNVPTISQDKTGVLDATVTTSGFKLSNSSGSFLVITAASSGKLAFQASGSEWTYSSDADSGNLLYSAVSNARLRSYNNSSFRSYGANNGDLVNVYRSEVSTKTVTSIAVKTAPSKTTYYEGETFDPTGLVITATYDDASTADIAYADSPSDFSFSPSGSLATTNNNVVITYKEKIANQAITVNSDTLNSITLGGSVTGSVSSGWDLSGVVVTGNYASGSRTITDATPTTSTPAPTEFKNYTVSVSVTFKGVTGNKDYNVKVEKTGLTPQEAFTAEEAIAKDSTGDTAVYVKDVVTKVDECSANYGNATFWFGSFELYRVKLDSSLGVMADDTIQVGQTVLVYGKIQNYGGTIEIGTDGLIKEISNKEVSSIAVTTNPTNPQYSGKTFDKTGMVVTATYKDSTTDDVTDSVVIEPSTLASNTTSVTIKYTENGITVQKSLSVDVLTLNKITTSGYTETFRAGDTFSFGGTVYPWYTHSSGAAESQGAALDSSEYTVSKTGAILERGNEQEVVVTHTASSKTCSYTIDVDYAYVTGVSFGDDSIELGLGGEATFAATVNPGLANQQVTYSIDTDHTTLGVGEYTLTGNQLTIAEDIAASGEVHVIATTVGKDSGGQSKSATCVVTVTKAVIAQITAVNVSGAVDATEQYVGKDFDYSGLTFTPVWSEGEHDEVTITGADIDWPELTEGMTSITGKYNTGSAELDVAVNGFTVVNDYLNSIEITGDMTNKTYYSNATGWNFEGLSVTGTNASGDPATITQASVEYTANLTPAQYLSTSAEKLVVTATYGGKTDTIDITGIVVNEYNLSKIEVTSNPTKTEYIIGESFSAGGLVVKATYSDGTTDTDFKGYTLDKSAIDMYVAGNYSVKVKADGVSDATFDVKYGVVTPQEGYDYWQKVTSEQTDWSGEYLLAYEDTTNSKTLFWTGVDAGHCHSDITTPSDYKLSSIPDGASSLIVAPMDGGYSIKVSGGTNNNKYIGQSSYANGMSFNDNEQLNTISLDDNGNAVICGSGNSGGTYVQMKYNKATGNTNERFRYYKSGQENVILYKHVEQDPIVADLIKIDASLKTSITPDVGTILTASSFDIQALFNDGKSQPSTEKGQIDTSKVKLNGDNSYTCVAGTNSITVSYTIGDVTVTTDVEIDLKTKYTVSFTGDELAVITTDLEDDYKMIEGEDYEILLEAQEKCVITKVTVDGVEQDPEVDGSYDIVIEDASQDVAIVIEGYQKYALTTSGTGVTFNTDDLEEDGTMHSGGNYTFTVAANDGYKITSIDTTGDGVEVSGNTITVTDVSSDVSITVATVETYVITVTGDTSCVTVTGLPEDGKMVAGEDYTITITKNTECAIDGVIVNGSPITAESDGSYKVEINHASEAVSIVVTAHGLAMFGITDSTDEYVTLVNTATQVKEGTTYESDVTFATGKELGAVSVTMGGVEVTGAYNNGHIKVENVSGDLVISITSKDVYFDVEYNFNHASGVAISPETSLPEKVVYNGSVSFKVEPESGYEVDTGHIMVKEDGAAKTFSYDSTTGILTVSNVTNALEIAIDAFKLAEVTKDLGDGLSISHESSPVSINGSYTLELSLADGKEITSVSVKMGGEPVDDAWNASTLTVYIATITDDIEIKIETKTIQIPINANGNITVDPEVKDYGSESVTVIVSPKEGYVITENSLYYTIGDDATHHTITGNSFVIDSLTEEINVYGETIVVYNLSYDLTDLTHSEADPYIKKDLDTFEIVLEVDGDKSIYDIDMTTFKVEMGGEDITGDITKVVYTHDKANGKLTIELVVSELTGDIKVTAARGPRLFDVSVTGQTDLVDVTGDLEIAYDSTGSITFTPADHYHFEANGIQVINSGSAEFLLDSQLDGSVILYLTGVKGDVSITVAVVHDLVSVTTGTLEHITFDFTTVEHENIEYGTAVTGHFTAEFGYERPISITVTCYGEILAKTDYAYNKDTGVFSIYAMGDIVISAKGTQGQVEVVATGDEHVSFNDGDGLPAITDSGLPFIATVEAEEGYKISSIVVTMNGSEVPNAYNEATGTITIQSVNDKINIAVTTVKLHSVEYDIENVTISDHIYEVVDNGTYTLIIFVNDGYELKNGAVSVIMGGEDVTGDVLGEGVIFISQVTGDVQISIKATKKSFSVTNTLTNASNSSAAITSVEYGASYQAVISAITGYENLSVTVKMGGVDVPCVNGVIIISKVTGAIEIEASAIASKVNVSVDVTNATCTIDSQQVDYNSALEFTLTQDDNTFDYVYSVTMGGEPVDGLNGVYTIEHVTGEIVIEASATIIELESITASLEYPYNLINYDSDFPIEWLEVIAHYNDGTTQEVTTGIEIDGYDRTDVGEQTVTVKALGFETTVDVEVLASHEIVEVTANTAQESYDFGYDFTKYDVDVYVETTDGTTYCEIPDSIEGYDITSSGDQTITVKYGDYTLQITVHINASTEIREISAEVVEGKGTLEYGDPFTKDDVIVTVTYTDGLHTIIPAEDVKFAGNVGENTVVVHAAGKTCTVTVNVNASTVISSISATAKADSYEYGYVVSASDFKVIATYEDGHIAEVYATDVSGFEGKPGINVVTVKVGEVSCDAVVKVANSTVVDLITVTGYKNNLEYGDTFTENDVTIQATFSDGQIKVFDHADSISGFTGKPGDNIVTVTLGDCSAEIVVTVLESTVIDRIEAVTDKAEVEYDGSFSIEDVSVTYVYTDGHKIENNQAETISEFNPKLVGAQTLTVTAAGKETTLVVTVLESKVIDHIEVSTDKTELEFNAAFTKDDVAVTFVYTDGRKVGEQEAEAISGYIANHSGEQVVTVYAAGKEATLTVTVKELPEEADVKVVAEKIEVEYKAEVNPEDIKITITLSDGTSEIVGSEAIEGFDPTVVGEQEVTVRVGGRSVKTKIVVKASVEVDHIEVSSVKPSYAYGYNLALSDVKVTYVYTDGHKVENLAPTKIEGYNATKVGEQDVVVTAENGMTATLKVVVDAPSVTSLDVVGYNEYVNQGQEYVFNGKVIAHYSDGSALDVTKDVEVSKLDTTGHGPSTLKVSYGGASKEVTINVIQTKGDLEPYQSAAIIGGTVVGISAIAVGLFFLLKKFKVK